MKLIITALVAGMMGMAVQDLVFDHPRVVKAQQGEMQALGLESECKSTLKGLGSQIETRMDEQANGDYQLRVYGGRRMVCEEKDVRIVRQPDAEEPMVVECKH